jgi:hypothetical protein
MRLISAIASIPTAAAIAASQRTAAVRSAQAANIGIAGLAACNDRRWEAPFHHHEFAHPVRSDPHDRSNLVREYRRHRRHVARQIAHGLHQLDDGLLALCDAVEVAHRWPLGKLASVEFLTLSSGQDISSGAPYKPNYRGAD